MDHRHLVGCVFGVLLATASALNEKVHENGSLIGGQLLTGTLIADAGASGDGSVRVYKLNSKNQMIRQRWTRNSEEAGCHDLWGTEEAYRFAQVGFAWCTVYAGDDCAAGSELPAIWTGGDYRRAEIAEGEPQIKILPGSNWYLSESENVKVGSWYCEY